MAKDIFSNVNNWSTGGSLGKERKSKNNDGLFANVNESLYGKSNTKKDVNLDPKRSFSPGLQKKVYVNQDGKCFVCKKDVKITHMEFHHKTSWHKGGLTTPENCMGLCHDCHKDIHDEERTKEETKKAKMRMKKEEDNDFGLNFPRL